MIFITGASGFIGRHVVYAVLAGNRHCRCLVRRRAAVGTTWPAAAPIVEGDLSNEAILVRAMEGCSAILHIAGAVHGTEAALWQSNVAGTQALCAAATKAGVRRIVFVSSLQANGRFGTAYGRSKLEAESALIASGADWTIVRPTQVYGPDDRAGLTRIAKAAGRVPIVTVPGAGTNLIQPLYVGDLAGLLIASLDSPAASARSFDVGGAEAVTVKAFIECAARLQQRRVRVIGVPMPLIRLVAAVGGRLSPWLSSDVVRTMTLDKIANNDLARQLLAFDPVGVAEGLRLTLGTVAPAAQYRRHQIDSQ